MKLSDWASLAEIVSGVAVVITLIFLVLGIRENSEITRAVAYERNVDSRNEWRMWVSENDERLRIYSTFLEGRIDDLNELEIDRLGFILVAIWSINEKTYYSNQYGNVGPGEWERTDRVLCAYQGTYDDEIWGRVSRALTPEFSEYVETNVQRFALASKVPERGPTWPCWIKNFRGVQAWTNALASPQSRPSRKPSLLAFINGENVLSSGRSLAPHRADGI